MSMLVVNLWMETCRCKGSLNLLDHRKASFAKTATKAEVTSQQVWGALLKEEARESPGEEVCFISREPAFSAASDQGGRISLVPMVPCPSGY